MEEAKVLDFKDGKVLISLDKEFDPNKDGEPVAGVKLNVWVNVLELPDEAVDFWRARKDKKA